MKKAACLFSVSSILLLFCLFNACSNSYDRMLEQFDSEYFVKGYNAKEDYSIESDYFSEADMLDDVIAVSEKSTLNLIAPYCGVEGKYEWKAIVSEKDKNNKEFETEYILGEERSLFYEIPGKLNPHKKNRLILTVSKSNGTVFSDTAIIDIE